MALPAPSRRRLTRRTASLVALGALALSGCGSAADEPAKAASTSAASPAPTTSGPVDTPTSPAVPSSETTLDASATLTDRLLPTSDVPGLTATWQWNDGQTGLAGA